MTHPEEISPRPVVVDVIVHEVSRHHDLLTHHVGEGEHGTIRVALEELVHDLHRQRGVWRRSVRPLLQD